MDLISNREWGVVMLDEVHVVPAQTFRKVMGMMISKYRKSAPSGYWYHQSTLQVGFDSDIGPRGCTDYGSQFPHRSETLRS